MKNQELQRLNSALIQYNICLIFPFMKIFLKCNFGLCAHFNYKLPEELKKLSIKRENRPICIHGHYPDYWFKKGLLKPRIELIKKAINNINNHESISKINLQ